MRFVALIAFLACIPAANWLIGNVGTRCIPNGPCVIPVGFGLMAPSGVLMIGLALVLRDLVHRWLGIRWVLGAIVAGAAVSAAIAPPALVIASATAFLLSELADTAVYTPLAERRLMLAVGLSSLVGLAIDGAVFLWLAFGSLALLPGQIVGKAIMVLAAMPIIWFIRQRELEAGPNPSQ
jgi:queuosine precursor transporter